MPRLYHNSVEIAHKVLAAVLKTGEVAIDATAGNGKDTLFLAKLVGESGKIFAFDIQKEALQRTKEKLQNANLLPRVELIHSGHEEIYKYVFQPISAAIFNLGYLPGGNKEVITKPDTTIQALEQCLSLLKPYGVIAMTVYVGHPGGNDEWNKVIEFLQVLPRERYDVLNNIFLNRKEHSPFTVIIQSLSTKDAIRGESG